MDRAGAEEGRLAERRFFCPDLEGPLALGAEAARHAHVLRLVPGDVVELFDGAGHLLAAEVATLSRNGLSLRAAGVLRTIPRPPRLVLVPCTTKGQKLDDVVRMTSELGVSAIRPAWSERSVVKGDAESGAKKRERWLRIACEATRQSEGAWLPEIDAPAPLATVLASCPPGARRLACLERTAEASAQEQNAQAGDETWLVVGPEGGLSAADRSSLHEFGFRGCSLGRSILRSETAAVVGVAILLSHLRP